MATENESRRWTPLPLSKEGRPPSTPRMEEVQLHPVFCSRRLKLLFKYCVIIYTKTIVRYLYVSKKMETKVLSFEPMTRGKISISVPRLPKLDLIAGVDGLTIIKSCWHSVSNQCHEDRALPNTHQLQKGVHKTDQMLEELWSEQG